MTNDLILLSTLLVWIVVGTSVLRWPPFWVLLIATVGGILAFQIPIDTSLPLIGNGFWGTVKKIGVLILLGSWIGSTLEVSGATLTLARALLKRLARWPMHFVVGLIGYWVAIPVFCDAAFVILNALNERLSEQSQTPKLGLTIALSTGLYATHVLVPPTPGPLAAAANFHLDAIFLLFLWGGLLAFILVMAGAAFAYWVGGKSSQKFAFTSPIDTQSQEKKTPSLGMAIAPIGIPILLMGMGNLPLPESGLKNSLQLIAAPHWALFIGGLWGLFLIRNTNRTDKISIAKKSLGQAIPIVAITAMGGALGKVLQQLPLADYLETFALSDSMGILIPFLLAAFLKTAQGSSTVAILTTSAIIYPLLASLGLDSDMGKVWGILAIGTGAMTVSHANDSYFWIVSQVGGIDTKTALRTHTIATLLQGLLGFLLLWATVQWIGK